MPALIVLTLSLLMAPRPASATPNISLSPPLIESFSHYFNESDLTSVLTDATQLGMDDAGLANSCGGYALAILDFGNPYYLGNNVYGVRDFSIVIGKPELDISYQDVELAAKNYIQGWQAKGSCSSLSVVIGTNNSNICSDERKAFCYYWNGYVLEQTAANLAPQESNIKVVGGSDIEMDDGNGAYYDGYAITSQWLNGYENGGSVQMYDYGDACQDPSAGCTIGWNTCEIYQAAYGIGYDVPIPEVYGSSQPQDWLNVQQAAPSCNPYHGPMSFYGIANESWDGLSWQQAWNDFVSTLGVKPYYPQNTCFPSVFAFPPTNGNCY